MPIFAGLDWGASGHVVCVVDERGPIQARFEASHDAAGLAELLGRLKRIAPPEALPVAIERPSGLVVDALVAAGHPVVPIHPNVVKACRPATAPPGRSPMPAMPTCSSTSCAPSPPRGGVKPCPTCCAVG